MEIPKPNNSVPVKKINTKKVYIILSIVVLLVVIAVIISVSRKRNNTENNISTTSQTKTSEADTLNNNEATSETNASSTVTEKVLTKTGETVKNDVSPMSPLAPQQITPSSNDQLVGKVLKLSVSNFGFSPKELTAKPGEQVTLSVTSTDGAHTLMFDDPAMTAVNLAINPLKTVATTFNAPTKKGEYVFRCDIPGHTERGESGRLIIK